MQKIINSSLFVIAAITLSSCISNKQEADDSEKKAMVNSVSAADATSLIADKYFLYKNLKSTLDVKLITKRSASGGVDPHLYSDSTFKTAYTELSPSQRKNLIAPFISRELDVNEKYATGLMSAYFIAKQDKIGDLQPIIIWITGDDYGSLTMILLDKNNNPVNGFNLAGGKQPGPTQIGDSLISYDARSFSFINRNEITSVKTEETDHTDTLKKNITIDSTVFKSVVTNSGRILTRQVVKTRYVRK